MGTDAGSKSRKLFGIIEKAIGNALVTSALLCSMNAFAADEPILFIGDSHVYGSFGEYLDQSLRTLPGAQVTSAASCGSDPKWWFTGKPTNCGYFSRTPEGVTTRMNNHPTPLFPDLMKSSNPRIVVIEHGTNYQGYPLDYVRLGTRKMVAKIQESRPICVWVGAPTMRSLSPTTVYDPIYKAMAEEIGNACTLIDSRKVTSYPAHGGGGIHYDDLGAAGRKITKAWADAVFSVVKKRLAGEALDPEIDHLYVSPAGK